MRIYTPSGELPYKLFTFPDSQQHFKLLGQSEFKQATVEMPIRNAEELFTVLLIKDVLDANGYVTSLNIRYLLGARMDRRISRFEPFTLQIVAKTLLAAGFAKIRVLDPHSSITETLLGSETVMPFKAIDYVLQQHDITNTVIIAPDAGAVPRIQKFMGTSPKWPIVYCSKKRDMATGNLSGFAIQDPSFVKGKVCLILDDICDGGGTFTGLAEELLKAGALHVNLFVTHGIFSKGFTLLHIWQIFTTDSYKDWGLHVDSRFISIPVRMHQ